MEIYQVIGTIVVTGISVLGVIWRSWITPMQENQREVIEWRRDVERDVRELHRDVARNKDWAEGEFKRNGEYATQIMSRFSTIDEKLGLISVELTELRTWLSMSGLKN